MAFKFDPSADYYSLFEACLGNGTTEVLDDPEDFNEFLQALKDGRYDPERGISPAKEAKGSVEDAELDETDLQGKYRQNLLAHIKGCCEVNNGWYQGHAVPAYVFTLIGGWIQPTKEMVAEFYEFINEDDVGVEITEEQYLEVALTFCETFKQPIEGKMKEYFSEAYYLLEPFSELDFPSFAVAFIKRNPEHRNALFAAMFEDHYITQTSGGEDGRWESGLFVEPFFSEFKDLIATKCEAINEYFAADEVGGIVDYSIWGTDVEELFTAAGINSSPEAQAEIEKQKKHRAMIEEECRKSKEIGAKNKALQVEADKKEAAEKVTRTPQETFEDACNDCDFDDVFANADTFKELIEENIDEIASNFTEDNEMCPTGNEPEWLMKALLKAGASIG